MLSIGQKLKIKENNNEIIIDIDDIPNTYEVKKGDTLYSIANKYNTTVDKLKDINNLNDNTLSIGQILYINNDNNIFDNYIVKKGDTLYSIANKYKISIDDLKRSYETAFPRAKKPKK